MKKTEPKPQTEAEKIANWRATRKPLDTPKGKYGWGKKSSGKKSDGETK